MDRATLNKWLRLFFFKNTKYYEKYLKKRKIEYYQYQQILSALGDPYQFPNLSKKEIIDKCEGNYRSLRESMRLYPDRFGITYEAYKSLSKFPPNIAEKIVTQYG